jgi:phosphatidyl-myo-inositol dimannoside synthase
VIAIATQCFAPDIGGIEALMTWLADELSASGVRVEVFADRVRSRVAPPLERPYRIHRFGSIRPLRRFSKHRAITRLIKSGEVSGIFADSWKSLEAIPQTDAPIAVLAHGTELPVDASPAKIRRIRTAFARARSIIASSNYPAGLVANVIGGPTEKILVVNPPIPPLPQPEAAALAQIDGLIDGRGPVFVSLARLEPRKGIDTIVRALPALRRKHPRLVYLIAGDGKDMGRLRELAAALDVSGAVIFLGPVVDPQPKAALLSRADIFVMPGRREGSSVEGFGIAFVEAAWYGAPALAGSDGGAADAVVANETGLLCDGSDDRSVAAALARLLDDEPLRRKLGAAAAERARGLVWSAALPRYLAAIGH